jgi:hypothetical protein
MMIPWKNDHFLQNKRKKRKIPKTIYYNHTHALAQVGGDAGRFMEFYKNFNRQAQIASGMPF